MTIELRGRFVTCYFNLYETECVISVFVKFTQVYFNGAKDKNTTVTDYILKG